MPIPKSRSEVIFRFAFAGIVLIVVFLAVINLYHGDALIPSILWLGLLTISLWFASREEGLRGFLINFAGELFGQHFVVSDPIDGRPTMIHFGFQLRGRRYLQKTIFLDTISSVEWQTGQATDLACRDKNDWQLWVWYDHNDSLRAEKERELGRRNPCQDLYPVGPAERKERTERLAQSFLAFLQHSGVDLIQDPTASCYARRWLRTQERQ